MAFHRLYQLRTGVPDTGLIQTNTIEVYANNSGVIMTQTSAGTRIPVGRLETGIIASANVVTGSLLGGSVSGWLAFVGPSGQKWAVPAFIYT